METFTFDDASKMTSEALFEQGWNSRVMPHGGRREGAGRPRGSGNGPTVETQQRLAAAQDLAIDRRNARKFVPRGIHLGVRLPANFGSLNHNRRLAGEPSEPSAKLATEYALTTAKDVAYGGSAGAASRSLKDLGNARFVRHRRAPRAAVNLQKNIRLEPYGRGLLCIADKRKATAHTCRHDQGRSRTRDRG